MNHSPSHPHRKPTSHRKVDANRRNAARSTGPRTTLGKSRSRLNALKHGILASQAVIANIEGREERQMFEATVAGLAHDFQPVGTYELLLVQEIAACFWRKRRLLMFENRAAFDAIEVPAADIVQRGTQQLIPWKEPLYTEGGQMTTAEQIYKHSGLDAVTLPNEKDTLRVIRYEAAINRTRERAVASLREMKKARRTMAPHPSPEIAPAVDRQAARRNASAVRAKLLSPWFTIRVWNQFLQEQEAEIAAGNENLRELIEGEFAEKYQTKPKTLTPEEKERRLRAALYNVFGAGEPPEGSEEAARDGKDHPDGPSST
jgi:hypothetical protein